MSNSCMCCSNVISGGLRVFTQVHPHGTRVPCFIAQFVNFDAETFCFLFFGIYCLKITLPLYFTITSSTAKFSEGYRILRNCHPRYQRWSLVSTVGHILRFGQVSVNCPQNAENVICVKICLVSWSPQKTECMSKSGPVVM